jgi:ATP-dependent Clp protease ATP-binding subunit ClpC
VFERYSEQARQIIFFGRYEASQFGAPEIQPEHILLGILRSDRNLTQRLFPADETRKAIRDRIVQSQPVREKVSTSVDLPLSLESKRALAYGAEEAERLGHPKIEVVHLLIGLAREESSLAARILFESGVTLSQLRLTAAETQTTSAQAPPGIVLERADPPIPDLFRDLTQAAEKGDLGPLIGRETELARVTQILSRRTKNSVALIGEPGVGKTAILEGLAQRFTDGALPHFSGLHVLLADANTLFTARPTPLPGDDLLCIEGLFDLAATRSDWPIAEAMHLLDLSSGALRCIATGTPAGLRATLESAPGLARRFEVVAVNPPDPSGAVDILRGLQSRYEQFHGVSFGEGTIETAVYASGRCLAHRALPDRALDLLDEAGALVRLRRGKTVTPEDVEQVVSDRVGVPVSAVKAVLQQKGPRELDRVIKEFAARIPLDANQWIALLAAYLVRSSPQEIDALVEAIRAAQL